MSLYLVTGAAGFLGSSITEALLARGHRVRALDNFSTGLRRNIEPFLNRIEFEQIDLANPYEAAELTRMCEGVDCIFHQAALPSVPRSVKDPRSSHNANIDGTFNLLEAARAAGTQRILYAASSSAYGNQPGLPRVETMPPAPIAPYPVQKLTGELYMHAYWQAYGIETVSLRYFNIFGPRQRPDSPYSGVMARFCLQMLRGETPVIFGDGSQARDFTFVENAVNANLLAAEAPAEKVAGRVFNIACGERHSLIEAFNTLAQLTGFTGQPEFAPARVGDIRDSEADISAAREAFGYQPSIGFEEGLRRTVAWHREEIVREEQELDTIAEEWNKGGCRGCS